MVDGGDSRRQASVGVLAMAAVALLIAALAVSIRSDDVVTVMALIGNLK